MAATLPSTSRPLVHYTIAELAKLELPQDGVHVELVHGQLIVSPLGSIKHQAVAMRLAVQLATYMGASGVGEVFGPGTIVFGDDSELQPDVLVVPGQRITSVHWRDIKERWLVVEVLSRSTRNKDLTVKRDAYLEFGVREIWFADPQVNTLTIVRPGATDVELESEDTLAWHAPGAPSAVKIYLGEIFFGR